MRTNIDIDDRLMRQAIKASGARTKKATVEAALKLLVHTFGQGSMVGFAARFTGRATSKSLVPI